MPVLLFLGLYAQQNTQDFLAGKFKRRRQELQPTVSQEKNGRFCCFYISPL